MKLIFYDINFIKILKIEKMLFVIKKRNFTEIKEYTDYICSIQKKIYSLYGKNYPVSLMFEYI